ncbi:hypothetical protein BT69DRAFT_1346059 [Atractiella rhizophila]|nr:hypothetical protein BT69DRAFT_1346059 [Atractiella rhizophila]
MSTTLFAIFFLVVELSNAALLPVKQRRAIGPLSDGGSIDAIQCTSSLSSTTKADCAAFRDCWAADPTTCDLSISIVNEFASLTVGDCTVGTWQFTKVYTDNVTEAAVAGFLSTQMDSCGSNAAVMLATIKEPDGTSFAYCAAVAGSIDDTFITNGCPTSLPQNAYAAPTQPVPTASTTTRATAGSTSTSDPKSAHGGSSAFRDAQVAMSVVGATIFLIASSFFV